MTRLEYRDLLVRTSLEGKFPAVDSNKVSCMYRTDDNRKCAFGVLIPDDAYSSIMEGVRLFVLVTSPMYADLKLERFFPEGVSLDMLSKVQRAHDTQASKRATWDHNEFVEEINHILELT